MSGHIPRRPTGSDAEFVYHGRVWDWCFGGEGKILNSPTVKASYTSKGIVLTAAAPGGGGTSLIQCVITTLYGDPDNTVDYMGVTRFDLSSMALVGDEFNCAKCYTGRQPDSEVIDGQLITYSQYNSVQLPANNPDNVRYATFDIDGVNTEWQVMHPRYLEWPDGGLSDGEDISQYLVTVSTLQNQVGMMDDDDANILYIETSPFRAWSYSPYLNGGND